ncbi:excisionase family DNA binding protein [Maribacter caenipelagi]|uniref:Excisionase family DNA binding protein n=1 Tax=Maribacter caenipelagi TaxID=1447781 RepID=A0A4R7D013_9FLAO|nr:helix-turn-helix domain-containing protein [Maribacter caenipelagi]TDS13552.1 excisionase family DNA binding protein [Maribacter caenipelagi]
MHKFIITTQEELTLIIDKSVSKKLDGLRELIMNKVNPSKQKLTVKEVAQKLNVTELTTRNYIQKGYIKADKIGRRVLIDASELEKSLTEIKSLKYKRL